MTNTRIDTAAIESLRSFASEHNEIQFAHLCTAALNGEAWAVERITTALTVFVGTQDVAGFDWAVEARLHLIHTTDTARPDGAVARKLEM